MNKGQKEILDKLSKCDMKKIDAKLAGKIKKILDDRDPKIDSEDLKSQNAMVGQLFCYVEEWLKAADLA